jgi:hypothetical protein
LVFSGEVAAEIREMEKNMPFTISVPIRLQENIAFLGQNITHPLISSPFMIFQSLRLQPFPLLFVSGLFLFSVSPLCHYIVSSVFTGRFPLTCGHKGDEESPIVCQNTGPVLILHTSWPVAYVITQETT